MNMRPALSTPLPWLAIVLGRFFSSPPDSPEGEPDKLYAKARQKSLRLPRSLKVTRGGKAYIGMLIVLGIAAINTGNNLLYLIVAMLLSLIVISGLLSESTLRSLQTKRTLPEHILRSTSVPVKITLFNRGRFLPSFSLSISEIGAEPTDEKAEKKGAISAEPAYLLLLEKGSKETLFTRYTFPRRGKVTLPGLEIRSSFPFGIFLKGRKNPEPLSVLVYPRVRAPKSELIVTSSERSGEGATPRRAEGGYPYGFRRYTHSDDARHIDWKASAKTRRLQRREYEDEGEKRVMVTFKNLDPDSSALFEEMVEEAASLCNFYIARGFSVGIRTLTSTVQPEAGQKHLYSLLALLALIKPTEKKGNPEVTVSTI